MHVMTMAPTDAGPARIMRRSEGRWLPVGDPLPPVDDEVFHEPVNEGDAVFWHFPLSQDVRAGDVLVVRESTVRLFGRCGPSHPAVLRLVAMAGAEWAAGRQVWSGRAVDPRSI